MFTEHPVLGLVRDVHLVLVPGHFGLTGRDTEQHGANEAPPMESIKVSKSMELECGGVFNLVSLTTSRTVLNCSTCVLSEFQLPH